MVNWSFSIYMTVILSLHVIVSNLIFIWKHFKIDDNIDSEFKDWSCKFEVLLYSILYNIYISLFSSYIFYFTYVFLVIL